MGTLEMVVNEGRRSGDFSKALRRTVSSHFARAEPGGATVLDTLAEARAGFAPFPLAAGPDLAALAWEVGCCAEAALLTRQVKLTGGKRVAGERRGRTPQR